MNRLIAGNHPRRWRAPLATLLALLLGGSLAGCGPGQGEVRGTVRYRGKPLPHGTIQFLGSDGLPYDGAIGSDGTFAVVVPAGAAKVIVRCVDEARLSRYTTKLAGRGGRVGPPPTLPADLSLIPQRYADWETSGLTVRVAPGSTVQDFVLSAP